MLRTIYLHGSLADRFGTDPITLDADDVTMLFRGLGCAHPEFLNELRQHDDLVLLLKEDDDIECVKQEDLCWPLSSKREVHIQAGVRGSMEGTAFAAWIANTLGVSATTAGIIATTVVSMAVSFVMGAVSMALAEKPEADDGGVEERKSGLFDQAVNLQGMGHPVPILYGRFRVGSVVISAEVTTEKNAVAIGDYTRVTAGESVTGNVLSNDIDGGTMTLTSFTVAGTTYSAGDTYSIPGAFSLTLNQDGSFSITAESGTSGKVYVEYSATSPTTPSMTAKWTIQIVDVWVSPGA